MMLKNFFVKTVKEAVKKALNEGKINGVEDISSLPFICSAPKNPEFGDFAINVSFLSKFLKLPPAEIANIVKEYIKGDNFYTNTAGGFINFKVREGILVQILNEILEKKEDYGKINLGNKKKVNIEYVSANPTGPFHIGHGRWAAFGSCLSEILKYTGYEVFCEFYVNDAGGQIQRLAKSLELRVKELKGEEAVWDEDLYRGEYLIPVAKKYIVDNRGLSYGDFAKEEMIKSQKELLVRFRTCFDLFFFEKSLYQSGEVDACCHTLEKKGKLYENGGAIWFKSSEYGDSQDRVLKKKDGSNTYLTADIAYHANKLKRGFDLLIDIWGADHHGYIPRMKAALDALGYDSSKLEILLGQLVNIIENGEAIRMGKRKKMVTLDELIDEVGVDATRYWMLMRSIDTTLDFDVELAKTKSEQNPVFYAQYAHARCCSVLRKAVEPRLDIELKTELPPLLNQEELDNLINSAKVKKVFSDDEKSNESLKKLLLKLESFKETIEAASRLRAPYMLCKYTQELSSDFHRFYGCTRILNNNPVLTGARLQIVYATKTVLAVTFSLLKVEAPEKM